ncbi:MAG TPA: hypothetical protein VIL00_14735 [Pseudonocardiaceae bacterium]
MTVDVSRRVRVVLHAPSCRRGRGRGGEQREAGEMVAAGRSPRWLGPSCAVGARHQAGAPQRVILRPVRRVGPQPGEGAGGAPRVRVLWRPQVERLCVGRNVVFCRVRADSSEGWLLLAVGLAAFLTVLGFGLLARVAPPEEVVPATVVPIEVRSGESSWGPVE